MYLPVRLDDPERIGDRVARDGRGEADECLSREGRELGVGRGEVFGKKVVRAEPGVYVLVYTFGRHGQESRKYVVSRASEQHPSSRPWQSVL